jgi:uncharacterized membrane protein YciS (DUF1049 family)
VIAVFIESALETSVALVLSYGVFSEGTGFHYTISRVLTVIFSAGFVVAIVFALIFLFVPVPGSMDLKERLENNAERFEVLYGELNYEESRVVLLYPFIFIAKRVIFVVCAFSIDYPILCLMITIITSTGNAVFVLHYRPFSDDLLNKFEAFNEAITAYFLIALLCLLGEYSFTKAEESS